MPRYPRSSAELHDLSEAARRFVLPGCTTDQIFEKTDRFWTLGSCFAANISRALTEQGIINDFTHLEEASNSPNALEEITGDILRGSSRLLSMGAIEELRTNITGVSGIVVTCGVGATPLNAAGQLSVPGEPDTWYELSVEQAESSIRNTLANIGKVNPHAHIFLTLSPVPLNRNFWNELSPVVADCVSKSTLRIGIHRAMKGAPDNVHYWPAFEIVRWLGAHRAGHYAADDGLQRHVSNSVVDVVIKLFLETFFFPDSEADDALDKYS